MCSVSCVCCWCIFFDYTESQYLQEDSIKPLGMMFKLNVHFFFSFPRHVSHAVELQYSNMTLSKHNRVCVWTKACGLTLLSSFTWREGQLQAHLAICGRFELFTLHSPLSESETITVIWSMNEETWKREFWQMYFRFQMDSVNLPLRVEFQVPL